MDSEKKYDDTEMKEINEKNENDEILCKEFVRRMRINDHDYVRANYMNANTDDYRHVCCRLACSYLTDINLIEFLFDKLKFKITDYDIKYIFEKINKSLDVSKYLINKIKAMGILDNRQISIMCIENPNFELIDYLFEICDLDESKKNEMMILLFANENIKFNITDVKSFINKNKLNISYISTIYKKPLRSTCFEQALWNKCIADDILEYLFHQSSLAAIDTICSGFANCAIPSFVKAVEIAKSRDYAKFNILISKLCYIYDSTIKEPEIHNDANYDKIMKTINPLLLNAQNLNSALARKYWSTEGNPRHQNGGQGSSEKDLIAHDSIMASQDSFDSIIASQDNLDSIKENTTMNTSYYPFENKFFQEMKFKDYVKYVDELKCKVYIPTRWWFDLKQITPPYINNKKQTEILFIHNSTPYFGHREVIYDSMLFLNDIKGNTNCDIPFVLDVMVPEYIVDTYINAICSGRFNMNDINLIDLKQFLEFIDRYPTKVMSIDILEDELIAYFEKNKVDFEEQYIKNIIHRYGLKHMYLHVHNKKMTN